MDENNNGGESTEDSGFGEVKERETPIADQSEDTQDEQVENDSSESEDTNSNQADDQQGEEGEETEDQDENSQEPKKTEKGTKLDPNPKSAVHQQLANERKIRGQMEQVLASPELIAKFVKEQYGIEIPTGAAKSTEEATAAPSTSTKKWTAKDFESLEDVADKFNGLHESFQTEISKRDTEIGTLKKQLGGITETSRITKVADGLSNDVTSLRTVAELNPKSPDFIPGLEDQIGALYHKFDFDEASGMYRGNYSLREIGESIINTARTARKAGSQQAQTIVKDKTGGKVRTTSGGNTQTNTDELAPADSIAKGIQKMFRN